MEFKHKPVLLNECIEGLNIKKDGIYVDGTLGGAGHSKEILNHLSNTGLLIGIDQDLEALDAAKKNLSSFNNVVYIHDNHDNIDKILQKLEIQKVDGILLDLGVSSYQLDEKSRGFSYMEDAKLDMRMDRTKKLTAEEVVNSYTEEELAKIFFEYGEEKYSKNICMARKNKKITTTKELVKIIEESIPQSKQNNGHPAKRTFQAIRIEVNDELRPLHGTILKSINCLKPEGRLAVITFHSLEDRIVKNAYIEAVGKCTCPPDIPYCVCGNVSLGKIVNKKPIVANEEEQKSNSRSRSAKLRIFERNNK